MDTLDHKYFFKRPSTYVLLIGVTLGVIALLTNHEYSAAFVAVATIVTFGSLIGVEKEKEERFEDRAFEKLRYEERNRHYAPVYNSETQSINLNNGVVEFKLTQRDLMDYVVSKETERLNISIDEINAEMKKNETDAAKSRDDRYDKILEAAKTVSKDFVNLFKDARFLTEVYGFRNHSRKDYQDRHYAYDRSATNWSVPADYKYNFQKQELTNGVLILVAMDKDKDEFLGSVKYTLSKEIAESIFKPFEDAEKLHNDLRSKRDALHAELHNVKYNSGKVMNTLIEQHLQSTPQGAEMLEKLNSISLSTTKILK